MLFYSLQSAPASVFTHRNVNRFLIKKIAYESGIQSFRPRVKPPETFLSFGMNNSHDKASFTAEIARNYNRYTGYE